jgi:adenosylcobinamide-GDP ribazoletransferase
MSWITHELRLVFIALQFFTRVPIPAWVGWQDSWLNQCARYFPLVGSFVGLLGGAALWLFAHVWPLPLAVVLATTLTIVATGAFHEDGLADTFDGLGGHVSRERALEIMKDSRLGTYGAVALGLVLVAKVMALSSLGSAFEAAIAMLVAHTGSRAVPVALIRSLPYAGDAEAAKAKPLAQRVSGTGLWVAVLWSLALAGGVAWLGWLDPRAVFCALSAGALAGSLTARWLWHRLGGYTGDALGASQQLSEVAVYLALAAAPWR